MNIVTAHQSSYLPWLGFFHKAALSDVFVVLDDVQFEKNSFSNRNKIKGPNGDFWLTVPVALKGHMSGRIRDIEISADPAWEKKHLKAIEMSYQKAPYFNEYISFFRDCYSRPWHNLAELNEYMLPWFFKQLNMDIKLLRMSDYSFKEKKSGLVLEICRELEADIYVFGALGRDYADVNEFNSRNIKVYFQDYSHPYYKQLHGEFIPNLSIVDLLFNCGPESCIVLMDNNITKKGLVESCQLIKQ